MLRAFLLSDVVARVLFVLDLDKQDFFHLHCKFPYLDHLTHIVRNGDHLFFFDANYADLQPACTHHLLEVAGHLLDTGRVLHALSNLDEDHDCCLVLEGWSDVRSTNEGDLRVFASVCVHKSTRRSAHVKNAFISFKSKIPFV